MTRVELNQLSMMQSVDQFLSVNQKVYGSNPAIVEAANSLKTFIGEIKSHSQKQAISTKAETAIKLGVKNIIIETLLKVTAAMAASAATLSDVRLKMAASITRSELKKLRDAELLIKTRAIFEIASPIVKQLEIWGISQADVDALDIYAEGYSTKSPEIRNLKSTAVQATSDLKAKFSETNTFIKKTLDPMMLPFRNLNPSFYGEYLKARTIIGLGGGHTKAVIDTRTGVK